MSHSCEASIDKRPSLDERLANPSLVYLPIREITQEGTVSFHHGLNIEKTIARNLSEFEAANRKTKEMLMQTLRNQHQTKVSSGFDYSMCCPVMQMIYKNR
jgi:hypothetical protein